MKQPRRKLSWCFAVVLCRGHGAQCVLVHMYSRGRLGKKIRGNQTTTLSNDDAYMYQETRDLRQGEQVNPRRTFQLVYTY